MFNKSLESILKPLLKVQTQLGEHQTKLGRERGATKERIAELEDSLDANSTEQTVTLNVLNNINNLLGSD